jgi:hypothetical protein
MYIYWGEVHPLLFSCSVLAGAALLALLTTYVVVRIWDLRRLILPLSYFIEKPFQNCTHTSGDLLGTVMPYADCTLPVEEVR